MTLLNLEGEKKRHEPGNSLGAVWSTREKSFRSLSCTCLLSMLNYIKKTSSNLEASQVRGTV